MYRSVVLVDAYAQVYRLFHVLPREIPSPKKVQIVADTFARSLLTATTMEPPVSKQSSKMKKSKTMFVANKVVVCFDQHGGQRRLMCPQYKAHRKPPPREINKIMKRVYATCDAFGVRAYPTSRDTVMEADDLIDTAVRVLHEQDPEGYRIVMSVDKDLLACLRHGDGYNTCVFRPRLDTWVTRNDVVGVMGVTADRIREVLALRGDPADGIRGVRGFSGDEKSAAFVNRYKTESGIIQALPKAEYQELFKYNLGLTTLQNVPDVAKSLKYDSLPFIDLSPPALKKFAAATKVDLTRYGKLIAKTDFAVSDAKELTSVDKSIEALKRNGNSKNKIFVSQRDGVVGRSLLRLEIGNETVVSTGASRLAAFI